MKQFWPMLDDAETVESVRSLSADGKFGDEIADILDLGIEQVISIRIRHYIEPAGGARPNRFIRVRKSSMPNTPEEVETLLRTIDELERLNNAVKEISDAVGSDKRVTRTIDANIKKLRASIKSKIN